MNKFDVQIFRSFSNNRAVAELYYESEQYAEISEEGTLTWFLPSSKTSLKLPHDEAMHSLEIALTKLQASKINESMNNPLPSSMATEYNEFAESLIDEITDHPDKVSYRIYTAHFGQVVDTYIPSGQGIRTDLDGNFLTFVECLV